MLRDGDPMVFAEGINDGVALGGAALLTVLVYAIRDWIKEYSDRKNKIVNADIAEQERADKANFDSRLTDLAHAVARCDEKHKACEEDRKEDSDRHQREAAERASRITELEQKVLDIVYYVGGFQKAPKPPKSGKIPMSVVTPPPKSPE